MRHIFLAILLMIGVLGCQMEAPIQALTKPERIESVLTSMARISGRFIDLTHTYDDMTVYWPTAEGFQLRQDAVGLTEKGYYYAANTITTAEHGGTHIDAPIHFFENGRTVDKIPLEQLIAEAVVVDVQARCKDNPDYQIGVSDLLAWEEKHGRRLVNVILLLRTGHARFWPDRAKYLGTTAMGEEAVSQLHFPGLDPEAAKWLAEQRAILAIGIDTPSIDFGQSTHFQSHVKLFEHNIPALENVDIPPDLPEKDFTLLALPMKIGGGSGGPTRIVAVVPD
ncbi:cyclase family protein [Nitrosococcus oceani]|uniref:cyclase family protein n=1 Tax=Nitrosococcus oceani TaxID=1229 RepID=UPI0004E8E7C6|nr:cyclase family protein [Nitrosococcus oceani]KFI22395.1 cyclase [Nitrosococcus oceani]